MQRSPTLLRFGWLLTGQWDAAEDLVQMALVKTWGRWDRILDQDPVAYVRRTMVNTHISANRRHRVREVLGSQRPESPSGEPFTEIDARLVVLGVLAALPPRQRAIVALRYYEDLSEADTATIMSCSVGTVKSQSSKALNKLRESPTLLTLVHKERSHGCR